MIVLSTNMYDGVDTMSLFSFFIVEGAAIVSAVVIGGPSFLLSAIRRVAR